MLVKQSIKTIPILMYHSISQPVESADPGFKALCVPPILFETQVDYLYRNGYTFLNVTQLVDALNGKSALPERPVVLTFDDGYADFYHHALPVLSRYQITATLYIATAFVERTSLWLRWKEETGHPILTWNQVVEISKSGIECGAHTHSHPKLDMLPLAMARDEIKLSKFLLEKRLNQKVTSFAYPYGFYTSGVQRLVKEAGFTSACAVNNAMCSEKADHFTLDRLMVTPSMDVNALDMLLTQQGSLQFGLQVRLSARQMVHSGIASMVRFYAQRGDCFCTRVARKVKKLGGKASQADSLDLLNQPESKVKTTLHI
jgi:peptidoglycan/xylan/chitin deacetylase (PgdA/CDA1 family)